jgi:hypothetical protein
MAARARVVVQLLTWGMEARWGGQGSRESGCGLVRVRDLPFAAGHGHGFLC